MAIFGSKKKTEKKVETTAVATVSNPVISADTVIIKPRITEKSGMQSQVGIYTFEVEKKATKSTVAKEIKKLYKVTPVKVSIINLPEKNIFYRGRKGVVSGVKKAIVTLKKGDKIDFV